MTFVTWRSVVMAALPDGQHTPGHQTLARSDRLRPHICPGDMGTYRLRAAADRLLDALLDARAVELELLDGLSDTQMLGERAHFLEPPIWEMGHVGWFQELWLSRHLDGEATLLPGSDGIYDSFNVSYRQRSEHRYPSR